MIFSFVDFFSEGDVAAGKPDDQVKPNWIAAQIGSSFWLPSMV